MTAYTSTAVRDGRIWRVQCDQHPTALSTVSRLVDAPAHQREAIAFVTQTNPDDVDVTVTPDVPDHDHRGGGDAPHRPDATAT